MQGEGSFDKELRLLLGRVRERGLAAGVAKVSEIRFDARFREACEANACGNYGRCWMCPPYAGPVDELIRRAQGFDYVLTYQTIGVLEDPYDFEGMMAAASVHSRTSFDLQEVFDSWTLSEALHLGAGGCHLCDSCAKRDEAPCRFPDRALPSIEAYGMDASSLAAACGLRYVNGENTVTYFGVLLIGDPRTEEEGNTCHSSM